jgi:hypothetical protein
MGSSFPYFSFLHATYCTLNMNTFLKKVFLNSSTHLIFKKVKNDSLCCQTASPDKNDGREIINPRLRAFKDSLYETIPIIFDL